MHELSIVVNIVRIADEQVKKAGASQIDHIELEIGSLAGIEPSALDFAWQEAVKNTVLANADRSIKHIQGRAKCLDCNFHFEIEPIQTLRTKFMIRKMEIGIASHEAIYQLQLKHSEVPS